VGEGLLHLQEQVPIHRFLQHNADRESALFAPLVLERDRTIEPCLPDEHTICEAQQDRGLAGDVILSG